MLKFFKELIIKMVCSPYYKITRLSIFIFWVVILTLELMKITHLFGIVNMSPFITAIILIIFYFLDKIRSKHYMN